MCYVAKVRWLSNCFGWVIIIANQLAHYFIQPFPLTRSADKEAFHGKELQIPRKLEEFQDQVQDLVIVPLLKFDAAPFR